MTAGVVVTGYGCVSAAGVGAAVLRAAALQGVSGRTEMAGRRLGDLRIRKAATVANYDPAAHFDRRQLAGLDPFSQFALLAASEAVQMSGLDEASLAGAGTAVIVGTGVGGISTLDEQCFEIYAQGAQRVDIMSVPKVMTSAAASQVSIRYGTTGPSFSVSSACASATQAIGIGMMLVRAGVARRALVGGSEACLTYSALRAWEALRVMSPDLCRPFSTGRNGMMLGEGAGMFLIEREDDATARRAPIQARLLGYGTTSDGADILRPAQAGCAGAMQAALADAGVSADDIGYINAHGTGTVANDATESAAIREVFGAAADRVPVSSTKPVHGHALGAAGALELAVSIFALQEQQLPPQINVIEPDPACPVMLAGPHAARHSIDYVLSNSFAFGGVNACLVVGR
jgi:nodulation protein E